MLTTQREHELPTFPFAAGPGVSTWRAVTLHVGITYIFLSYAIRHGRGWLPQTSVFWRHEDALAFCKQFNKNKKRKLLDIYLLVPIPEGAVQRWGFVQIREVFAMRDVDSETDMPLYVTVDGEVIGDFIPGELEENEVIKDYQSLPRVFPA